MGPSSPSAKKRKEKSRALSAAVEWLRLGDIPRVHFLVEEFEQKLRLPCFPQPPREGVSLDLVRVLLERMPLLIRQERKEGMTCVGNIRLYRLACLVLRADELVPALRDSGSLSAGRRGRLRQGLLAETFLLPAVFGRRPVELEALQGGWEKAAAADWVQGSFGTRHFSDLLPEATRRPKKRRPLFE